MRVVFVGCRFCGVTDQPLRNYGTGKICPACLKKRAVSNSDTRKENVTMIKIGNTYFAENAIEAIVPECVTDRRSDKKVVHSSYDVHLASGDIVCVKATEEEIAAVTALLNLATVGEVSDESEEGAFKAEELEEFRTLYDDGFKWIACDRDGKAYAYKDKPVRGYAYWQGYEAKRLGHELKALSFGDATPLDLTMLFAKEGETYAE